MRYYHGTGRARIDEEGFQKNSSNLSSSFITGESENNRGVFFTSFFELASYYAEAKDSFNREVWILDSEIPEHAEILKFAVKNEDLLLAPDYSGEQDEYIIPWDKIEGFIPMTEEGDFSVIEV